jgi:hypothetical protein
MAAGPVPIPYPNIGKSSDTSRGPSSVKVDGNMPMDQGGQVTDEPGGRGGERGGVVSNKIKGTCEFMLYSFDMKIEGNNACRLRDSLLHNDKNGMG